MFRALALFVPITLVACHPVDSETRGIAEPDGGETAGPIDGGDAPLPPPPVQTVPLTVQVKGDAEDTVVMVARSRPSGRDDILVAASASDGVAHLRLPVDPRWSGEWRVGLRSLTPDGDPGAWLDVSPATLRFVAVGVPGAPGGWQVWGPDSTQPESLARGFALSDRLAPRVSTGVDGGVADDVSDYEFSVGHREVVRLPTGQVVTRWLEADRWTVTETRFTLSVGGPPSQPAPLTATWWPVAFMDNDTVDGFDGDSDLLVGELCLRERPVAFQWVAPPETLAQADAAITAGLRPGWTAMSFDGDTWRALDDTAVPRFQAACE